MTHKLDEKAHPLSFFGTNVDGWGAAEWFDRLAKAIRAQDAAVVAGDAMWETYKMIAASSAMALVREHEATVRNALAAAPSPAPVAVKIKTIDWVAADAEGRRWYGITDVLPNYRVRDGVWWTAGEGQRYHCDSLAEAKDAAQADYERRIRSALVDPVADEAGGREPLDDRQLRMNL